MPFRSTNLRPVQQPASRDTGPFRTEGKVEIRAISHDPALGKSGPAALETFDISKRDWTLVCISEKKSAASAD